MKRFGAVEPPSTVLRGGVRLSSGAPLTRLAATAAATRDPGGGLVGLRTGAARSYYLFDGLGSVVAVTDASGNVTNSYTVQPSLPPAQGQDQRHK